MGTFVRTNDFQYACKIDLLTPLNNVFHTLDLNVALKVINGLVLVVM